MVKPTRVTNSIRSLRFANGEMTQADLADRVGVTRQTIIAIEQGKYSPTLEMAFRIARVFQVPIRSTPCQDLRRTLHSCHRAGSSARSGRCSVPSIPSPAADSAS
jgi:putative transcriptional regulator